MAKELPIGFTMDMVKAILDGRKTVTRRVIKFPLNLPHLQGNPVKLLGDWALSSIDKFEDGILYYHCQTDVDSSSPGKVKSRYQPSDLLWVKETFNDYCDPYYKNPVYRVTDENYPGAKWKSSRFMPKKYARTWLEVISVRPERLQDISLEDCYAEGIESQFSANYKNTENIPVMPLKGRFKRLWDSINAKRGYPWESNPWVWRIEFKEATNG